MPSDEPGAVRRRETRPPRFPDSRPPEIITCSDPPQLSMAGHAVLLPLECRAMDRFRASCNGGLTDTCRISLLASSRVPAGIRKQSCLERKCRQPTAAPVPGGSSQSSVAPNIAAVTTAVGLAKAAAQSSGCLPCGPDGESKPGMPPAMPPQEWDAFWSAVECCMLLQVGAGAGAQADGDYAAGSKRARTNRCGTCEGCTRGDCGTCKNCKDKPKFGGPGVKKQACVRRSCTNPLADRDDFEEEDDDDGAGSTSQHVSYQREASVGIAAPSAPASEGIGGFTSGGMPSPSYHPTEAPAMPPAFDLGADPALDKGGARKVRREQKAEGMMDDTRRRLQEFRAQGGSYDEDDALSMDYSTAGEDDEPYGSQSHSSSTQNSAVGSTDDADGGSQDEHADAIAPALSRAATTVVAAAPVAPMLAAAPVASERVVAAAPVKPLVAAVAAAAPVAAAPVAAAPVAAAPVAAAAAPTPALPVVASQPPVAASVVGRTVTAAVPPVAPHEAMSIADAIVAARTVRPAVAVAPAPAMVVAARPSRQ